MDSYIINITSTRLTFIFTAHPIKKLLDLDQFTIAKNNILGFSNKINHNLYNNMINSIRFEKYQQ